MNNQENLPKANYDQLEEKTFMELVIEIRDTFKVLLKNWVKILIPGILLALVLGMWAFKSIPEYEAKLVFMVDDEKASGFSTASAILGTFGIGSGGRTNQNKILEIAKSQQILFNVLLSKETIDGKMDYFANHFIEIYNIQLNDNKIIIKHGDIGEMNSEERQVLKKVYALLAGEKGILSTGLNEDSGLMTISLKTQNESLSIQFLRKLFDDLSDFYITRSIKKEAMVYKELRNKTDSIYRVLNKQGYTKSQINDQSLGLYLQTDQFQSEKLDRDSRVSLMMYGEVLKNMEVSRFALSTKTPLIIPIDEPIAPLKPLKKSALIFSFGGLMFGILLASFVILFQREYRKANLRVT